MISHSEVSNWTGIIHIIKCEIGRDYRENANRVGKWNKFSVQYHFIMTPADGWDFSNGWLG